MCVCLGLGGLPVVRGGEVDPRNWMRLSAAVDAGDPEDVCANEAPDERACGCANETPRLLLIPPTCREEFLEEFAN